MQISLQLPAHPQFAQNSTMLNAEGKAQTQWHLEVASLKLLELPAPATSADCYKRRQGLPMQQVRRQWYGVCDFAWCEVCRSAEIFDPCHLVETQSYTKAPKTVTTAALDPEAYNANQTRILKAHVSDSSAAHFMPQTSPAQRSMSRLQSRLHLLQVPAKRWHREHVHARESSAVSIFCAMHDESNIRLQPQHSENQGNCSTTKP